MVITVTGRVHGVGYRYSAVNMAERLGLKGYVKNQYNGTVLLEIEGSELAVEQMIHWSKEGPGTAHVSEVHVREGSVKNYESFSVKY